MLCRGSSLTEGVSALLLVFALAYSFYMGTYNKRKYGFAVDHRSACFMVCWAGNVLTNLIYLVSHSVNNSGYISTVFKETEINDMCKRRR